MKRRRRLLSSPLLVVPIVVAALWVNWPTVRGWFGSLRPGGANPGVAPDPRAGGQDPTKVPAMPGGIMAAFAPITADVRVPDPFQHPVVAPESDGELVKPSELVAPSVDLPDVSLVLLGPGGKRAVIDGKVVGVGDSVKIGVVREVIAGGVQIRIAGAKDVFVPLRAAPEVDAVPSGGAPTAKKRKPAVSTTRDPELRTGSPRPANSVDSANAVESNKNSKDSKDNKDSKASRSKK